MWKNLSAEERAMWDDVAAKDKQRYMVEKAMYNGPWQVPWKRVKKDPSAPKRPMSAFLYYSQGKRSEIKSENPDMKNTDVSRILGDLWRNLSVAERAPFVDREKTERDKYKVAIAAWRQENEAKVEAERKTLEMHPEVGVPMVDSQLPMYHEPFVPQHNQMMNAHNSMMNTLTFPPFQPRTLHLLSWAIVVGFVLTIELVHCRSVSEPVLISDQWKAAGPPWSERYTLRKSTDNYRLSAIAR
jgi:HMG (high mobility group) box